MNKKEIEYDVEICPKCKKQWWHKCLDCNRRTIIVKLVLKEELKRAKRFPLKVQKILSNHVCKDVNRVDTINKIDELNRKYIQGKNI